jgi:hypothetical protein
VEAGAIDVATVDDRSPSALRRRLAVSS